MFSIKKYIILAMKTTKIVFMKKITLGLLFICYSAFSQTVLLDPNGDGGFETGATFAENGWLTAQQNGPNKKWYVGTGQSGYSGNRAAFIGNDETTPADGNAARTVHLYRSVTVPEGATNIVLTFKYKQAIIDFSGGNPYDYITVRTGTAAPVNGTEYGGALRFGPFPDASVPLFAEQTVTLPNSIAGVTRNLVFTFLSDDVNPRGVGAIDDVSITYTPALSTIDFAKASIKHYPNPVKNILYLTSIQNMENAEVYNLLGQKVMQTQINSTEKQIDMSGLPSGNYLVKVNAENATQTLKIIKQ